MSEELIDPLDVAIWGAVLVGSVVYWLKDRIGSSSFSSSSASSAYKKSITSTSSTTSPTTVIAKQPTIISVVNKSGKTRNFVQKMKQTVRLRHIFRLQLEIRTKVVGGYQWIGEP